MGAGWWWDGREVCAGVIERGVSCGVVWGTSCGGPAG